jgi:LPS-assembly protein
MIAARCLPVLALLAWSAAVPAEEARPLAWEYWKPRSALSEQELSGLPDYCRGRYVWPALRYPSGVDDSALPVFAESQAAEYLRSGDITLTGDVIVRRGNRTMKAPEASLNKDSLVGRADSVLVEQENFIVRGSDAEVDFDTSEAQLSGAEFLQIERGLRGRADHVEQLANGTLVVSRGSFTSCEPDNGTWRITARRVTVEKDSIWGRARDAVLRVGDVPVMWTPYLRFPVSDARQSGWLFPVIGYSDDDGMDIALPYYLNLAPNYDATITPRWVSDRGLGVETEFRSLSSWQETRWAGAFLPDDDLYNGTYTKSDWDNLYKEGLVTGEFNPEDRWLYAMYHTGREGRFRTFVDYTAVSDRDYFRDLGTTLKVSNQRELERLGEVTTTFGDLSVRLWAQRFDRLDEVRVDPYQRLPELAINYLGELPGPFEFSLGAAASRFDRHNEDLVGLARMVGDRFHVDPRLRLPLYRSWGFLSLTGGLRYTSYDLNDTEGLYDDQPQRSIGLGIVDTGLFFERELNWFDTDLVQTLEPRIYYLYQEYEDQNDLPRFDTSQLTFRFDQLFRDNRFAGIDRIGDANQISTGLTSRFVKPDSGRELFRASVGTIFYLANRKVTVSGVQQEDDFEDTSAVAAEVTAPIGPWRLTGSVVYDPHQRDFNEGGGFLQYRSDNDHIVSLGYRYRAIDDVDQTDVAVIWPITKHYSLIGHWNYDIESGRTIEGLGGIEYNNCCWQVRVVGRRFIDSPSAREIANTQAEIGGFVQIVFKGLAGVGTKMESLLERSIRGYQPED